MNITSEPEKYYHVTMYERHSHDLQCLLESLRVTFSSFSLDGIVEYDILCIPSVKDIIETYICMIMGEYSILPILEQFIMDKDKDALLDTIFQEKCKGDDERVCERSNIADDKPKWYRQS